MASPENRTRRTMAEVKTDPKLLELLERARDHKMTPEEIDAQRRSWVRGNVKKRDVFTKYGPQARAVLDALLEKYRDEGVLNLDDTNVLKIEPFSGMGSVVQLIKAFGGKEGFEKAVHELQDALYQEIA
jgi:hypothetical protein